MRGLGMNVEGDIETLTDFMKVVGLDIDAELNTLTDYIYNTLETNSTKSLTSKQLDALRTKIALMTKQLLDMKDNYKAVVNFLKKTNTIKNNLRKQVGEYGNTGQMKDNNGLLSVYESYINKLRFTRGEFLSIKNLEFFKTFYDKGHFKDMLYSIYTANNSFNEMDYDMLDDEAKTILFLAEKLVNSYDVKQKHMDTDQVELLAAINGKLYKIYDYWRKGNINETRNHAIKIQKRVNRVNARIDRKQNRIINKIKKLGFDALNPREIMAYIFGGTYTKEFKHIYEDLYKTPYVNQIGKYHHFMTLFSGKKDENIKNILKRRVEKIKVGNLTMNRYVLYQFYLNSKSPDNTTRMNNANLTFTNNGTTQNVAYKDLLNAVNDLTTEEITELDNIFNLYNTEVKQYIEEMSEKVLGFSVSRENYYPIVGSDAYKIKNFSNPNEMRFNINAMTNGRLKSLSNTKTKIEINVDPIILFDNYIESMTITGEIGLASQELNRILQLKNKDGENVMSIISQYMPNSKEFISSIFNKLIGNTNHIERNGLLDRWLGRYATATLGLNPSSMLKQIGSYFTAWTKVGVKNGIKATFNLKHYARLRQNAQWLQENNPVFANRIRDNGYVRATTLNNVSQIKNKALRKLTNAVMKPIEWMDRMTCYATFTLCQEYVKSTHGYEIGTEENLQLANDMFTDMLLETQSNSNRIAMSRVRSGEKGWIVKNLFGLFQSDGQNKISLITELFINARNIRADLREIENQLKTETDADKIKELENRKQELLEVRKQNNKQLRGYSVGLSLSGAVEVMVGLLIKWLYDREEPEDTEFIPVMTDLFMATTVDFIPYLNQIINWFEYDGVELSGLSSINDFIDATKEFSEKFASGDLTSKDWLKYAIEVAPLLGIPAGNINKIYNGLLGNISPELALKYGSLFYSKSQSNLSRQANEYLAKGHIAKARAYIGYSYDLYKFTLSDDVLREVTRLKGEDVKVSVKNLPTSYLNEKGEETALTSEQNVAFRKIYTESNKALELLLKDSTYKRLSNADKAKAISKITDLYYEMANTSVFKVDLTSKLAKFYASTKGKFNLAKYVPILVHLNTLLNNSKNRKQTLMQELNMNFRNLTKLKS